MFESGFVTAQQLTIFVIKALHKHFVWEFLVTGLVVLNVNVTRAVFVAAIIGNDLAVVLDFDTFIEEQYM